MTFYSVKIFIYFINYPIRCIWIYDSFVITYILLALGLIDKSNGMPLTVLLITKFPSELSIADTILESVVITYAKLDCVFISISDLRSVTLDLLKPKVTGLTFVK